MDCIDGDRFAPSILRTHLRRRSRSIPRRGHTERQVRHQLLPGGLIGLPIGGIGQRRDRDELALIEAGERGVDGVGTLKVYIGKPE